MKHTMKMVLIPESEYKRLKPEEPINKVLAGKRDYKSATELGQLFGRYLRTKEEPIAEVKPLSKDYIAEQFGPIYRDKIVKFLTELEKYGSSWDHWTFITKHGEHIGDIRELLKEAFIASGKRGLKRNVPKGWVQFINEVIDANIKRSTFTKSTTKADIEANLKWESF